jgi:hypothetical protein
MTDDELKGALLALAKRMEIPVGELIRIGRMSAQSELDPLPVAEWGAPFTFGDRVCLVGDFVSINAAVPPPDAEVDYIEAMEQFCEDVRAIRIVPCGRVSAKKLALINQNQLAWARFWAVRGHTAARRALFAAVLEEESKCPDLS